MSQPDNQPPDTQPMGAPTGGNDAESEARAAIAQTIRELPVTEAPPPPGAEEPSAATDDVDARRSIEVPPPSRIDPVDDDADDAGAPAGAKDPYLGTTFDKRYKIEQVIGEGGMGFVYLARHKVIDKKVAIKVLRSDMARDRENLDRFLQEARAASSIGNPHIVDISDFGDLPDGSTYFVMEYLDGGSLSHFIDAEKPIKAQKLCHIGIQMTDGLAAAHAGGIVHRDLKPDNIKLIARGGDTEFVKILDFGIAKVMSSAEQKLTVAGAVFGTPHYMSPEQAAGTPVDSRTDIYSLGVILYEMASGKLPFNADNFMAILSQHMYQAPTPIREIEKSCSPGVEAVILKCLSKKPEARYQTMEELGADLARIQAGEIPTAVAEMVSRQEGFDVPPDYFKRPSTLAPPKGVKPGVIYAAAAAALGLGVVVVGIALRATTPPAPTPPAPTTITTVIPVPSADPTPPPTATSAPSAQPPASPKVVKVALAATPEAAMAYINGKPPLKLPSSIDIEEGKTETVEVRAYGYETSTVILDGSEPIKLVKLLPRAAGTAKTAVPGIVDPFDPARRGPH